MKVTVDIVKITPKQAEEMLGTQVKEQRPLRDLHVQTLANDMKEGNFRLSADCLVLIKGALANGQHRLWAVIEANQPQPFLLMRTDDDELYKVLDCGIKRTVADAAHVSNGASVTAIANLAMAYRENRITQHSFAKKATRIDLVNFIQAHNTQLQEAHSFVKSLTKKSQNIAPTSAPGALLFLSRDWHGKKPFEFLEAVYHGTEHGSITHELREKCIKIRMGKGVFASQFYLALFIKSFNAFISNQKLQVIKMMDSETYPQIIRPPK